MEVTTCVGLEVHKKTTSVAIAELRLCHRSRRLAAAGKPKVVVTTAILREMVGLIWAIARIVQPRAAIG